MTAAKIYNKILLILGVILLSVTAGFIGYSVAETIDAKTHTYYDYDKYTINYRDIFLQGKAPEYYVFFYNDSKECDSLEYQVTKYIDEYKKANSDTPLYLVNVDRSYKNLIELDEDGKAILKVDGVGKDNPDDLRINGVPFLIRVKDHQVFRHYSGVENVSKALRERI